MGNENNQKSDKNAKNSIRKENTQIFKYEEKTNNFR